MAFLDSLLGRFGYVRLNEFGLVRTADGRIVMLHRRVLDDGAGGRIVGWRAEDPAPTILESMELVPRGAAKPIEAARAMPSRAVPPRAPVRRPTTVVRPVKARPPTAGVPEDEDEWEWQLAMARARAAADEAEQAAAAIVSKELPTLVGVSKSQPVLAVAKLTPSRQPSTATGLPIVAVSAAQGAPIAATTAPAKAAKVAKPAAVIVSDPVPSPPMRPSRVSDPIGAARRVEGAVLGRGSAPLGEERVALGMTSLSPAPVASRAPLASVPRMSGVAASSSPADPVATLVDQTPPVPIERARIARGSSLPSSRVMSPPRTPRAPMRTARAEPAAPVAPIAPARSAGTRAADARPLPLPPPDEITRTRLTPLPLAPSPVDAEPAALVAARAPAAPAPVASAPVASADGKPTRRNVASMFDAEITQTDARPPLPRFSARFR